MGGQDCASTRSKCNTCAPSLRHHVCTLPAPCHGCRAPPPGLAEAPIPPESEEDEHEYVEHVDLKVRQGMPVQYGVGAVLVPSL